MLLILTVVLSLGKPTMKLISHLMCVTIQSKNVNLKKLCYTQKPLTPITIFANESKETQRLTNKDVEKFVNDWNNSKTRGYYPDEPFDSAFSVFPAYQYRVMVFLNGQERPFYAYNYVILDSSNWKYEMSKAGDLKYIHNYWKN